MKMAKYGVFKFQNYYPSGGFDDFLFSFNGESKIEKVLIDIETSIISEYDDNVQIVNFETLEYKTFSIKFNKMDFLYGYSDEQLEQINILSTLKKEIVEFIKG